MEALSKIDYGELKFPISGWAVKVALGLMTPEEALRLTIKWLADGGMLRYKLKEGDDG